MSANCPLESVERLHNIVDLDAFLPKNRPTRRASAVSRCSIGKGRSNLNLDPILGILAERWIDSQLMVGG
jgi:hypothetical protein